MKTLLEEINKMEKKEFDSKMFTDYEDRFQILCLQQRCHFYWLSCCCLKGKAVGLVM